MSRQPATASLKRYPMPFVRMELAIFTVVEHSLHVLLVQRQEEPYAGQWALPGGVLRTDLDDTLDAAAQRVGQERLGVPLPWLRQQVVVGGAARDPRASWTLSVVYRGLVPVGALSPVAGKRVQGIRWVPAHIAAQDPTLAFDHSHLVADAVAAIKAEIDRLELPAGFLPDRFTLADLQRWCEALAGKKLDKSSFRRRLAAQGVVRPMEGVWESGKANRPAQLFELATFP